ncbi:MAG TPA: hypothetical protein VK638_44550, partial [Edaphobacter sp.]|nr:hypothetical protein [Edaphobacter sp.]
TETPLPKPPKTKPEPEDPLLHGRQGVPDLRQPPPPKPPVEPKIVRPGPEEARQARLGALNEQIKWVQHRGKWVASGAAFSGVLYGVLNGKISKVGEAIAAGGASLVLTNKFANFLERPGVQEWLTRPEPSDLQYFQKLPPEQRAAVAEGLRPAVDEARSKGLKVSPALLTLVGAQLSQPKTAGEAKQQAAATQRDPYMVEKNPKGLVAPGNLPIWSRPTVKNADGSHSTEYSTSFQDDDGSEVLVPTVVNGRFLTPDGKKPPEKSAAEKAMFKAAWQHYKKTGQNLGKFKTPDDADTYAGKLHNR